MKVSSVDRQSSRGARCPSNLQRASRSSWGKVGSGLVGIAVATGVWAGCGSSGDEEDSNVPGFSGLSGGNNGQGTGGTSTAPGAAGNDTTPIPCTPGSVGCPSSTREGLDPSTPIAQPGPNAVGSVACTPNTASCSGNVLSRCDAAGLAAPPLDCAASGGTCGQVAGVASCVAPRCTPGAVTCETANTVGTCAADGSGSTVTRCPDGTNCTGAGQCTPVACNPAAMLSANNGGVTVYWFAQGTYSNPRQTEQDVNCSFGSDGSLQGTGQQDRVFNIPDERLFGAMNGVQYNNAATCGACVELRNPQNNRTVTITVVDSCVVANGNPTCTEGHIDLSRAAFEQLTGQTTGDINNISWNFVPCTGDAGVQFQLKQPDNEYWNQFIVLNHRYPIARAEVEMEPGRWVDARRESYNYWLPPEGDGGTGGDMGTYRVRVTDVNGAIIEEQLALRAGLQGGSGQFACE
jgi:expansin (peptidoglycan-binding protein)